jgi:MFS family permease
MLAPRLPFYYGWLILACVCLAGFARQGGSVAVLSIFVEPMRSDLGWPSVAFGGAVSLGGVLAALVSPAVGRLLDRRGARALLAFAVVGTGLACLGLSLIETLAAFYVLFCFARMNWAGPFDLGLYGALNAWFIARRARAASIATVAQLIGLVAFPLIAHAAIAAEDWRAGWIAVGTTVLLVGFLPVWMLLVRRPEDIGMQIERVASHSASSPSEHQFSREEALRTPAFWLLALYTALMFPCQAGVSLYQASHLVSRGIDPGGAALIVSSFSFMSALSSLGVGWLPRRLPIRYALAASATLMSCGAALLFFAATFVQGWLGSGLFGMGVGAMLTLLPVIWADYFGRTSYGAIRGVALSIQVLAQACGPLAAGALRDATGAHAVSLGLFALLASLGAATALLARRPP